MNNKSFGFLCYVLAVRVLGFGFGFDFVGVFFDFCFVEFVVVVLLLFVCVSLLGFDGCDFLLDFDFGGEELFVFGFDLIGEDFEVVLGVFRIWGKFSFIFDIFIIINNNYLYLIYFVYV